MNFEGLRRFRRGIPVLGLAVLLVDVHGAVADASANPLPPVKDVLKRIVERSAKDRENDRQFDARYEYQRVKTREVRTTKGTLKQSEVTRRLNQPRGSSLETAGSDPAASREETRADAVGGKSRSRSDYGKKDFPITDEMLSRFDFTMAGREVRNGRPALILDFQPVTRDVPVKTFLDRFVNRMAGRFWVDESESVVVRADLRLTETVTFVAGIAGAVYQLDCDFERFRTQDGLWYTPRFVWRADWRELLSRKVVTVGETKDNLRLVLEPVSSSKQASARIELP